MAIGPEADIGNHLLARCFAPFGGSGYPEGMTMSGQVIAQLIAILAIAGWSVFGTLVAALSVSLLLPMRDTTDPV